MMRRLALSLALLAAPVAAQITHPPVVTEANLPVCSSLYDGQLRTVKDAASQACNPGGAGGGTDRVLCLCDSSVPEWVVATAGGTGGSGDVTAVGDCSTGACFQSVTARWGFMAPAVGGVASFRAIAEADISDLSHTTDTGPSPDCSGTSTYQDGDGGCDTVGGDISGGLDAVVVADDSHAHTSATVSDFLPLFGGTMTGQMFLPDGGQISPSIAFDGDPWTGIYSSTDGNVTFSSVGIPSMEVSSSATEVLGQLQVPLGSSVTESIAWPSGGGFFDPNYGVEDVHYSGRILGGSSTSAWGLYNANVSSTQPTVLPDKRYSNSGLGGGVRTVALVADGKQVFFGHDSLVPLPGIPAQGFRSSTDSQLHVSMQSTQTDNGFEVANYSDTVTYFAVEADGDVVVGSGDLSVSGSGKMVYATTPHGSLIEDDGSGTNTITVTTAGTYYGWTTATAGSELAGMTADVADATADHLTIATGAGGVYFVSLEASFSGTISAVVKCYVFDSGVSTGVGMTRKIGTGGDVGDTGAAGLYRFADADEVSLRCTSDSNGDVINVYNFGLSVYRIGN